jgi:hypothetical protein
VTSCSVAEEGRLPTKIFFTEISSCFGHTKGTKLPEEKRQATDEKAPLQRGFFSVRHSY